MSKRTFKPGDRVVTNSTAHEPSYGHVEDIMVTDHPYGTWLKGEIMVVWERESGAGVTYERPTYLTHAPKLPVKMRRVGWLRKHEGELVFYTNQEQKDFWRSTRGATPVYAKKGDDK